MGGRQRGEEARGRAAARQRERTQIDADGEVGHSQKTMENGRFKSTVEGELCNAFEWPFRSPRSLARAPARAGSLLERAARPSVRHLPGS